MALYSTFFVCDPKAVPRGFPGWRLPLEKPVKREFVNPFTGTKCVVETREPEWPEDQPEETTFVAQVVAREGDYASYLESRLLPYVVSQPHWAAKGLTSVELDPLCGLVGVAGDLQPAMYAPPSLGSMLYQFPPGFPARMKSLDPSPLAKRWAQEMSRPEYTHSVSGERVCDDWTIQEALEVLQPLAHLAGRSVPGQEMYLLIEA